MIQFVFMNMFEISIGIFSGDTFFRNASKILPTDYARICNEIYIFNTTLRSKENKNCEIILYSENSIETKIELINGEIPFISFIIKYNHIYGCSTSIYNLKITDENIDEIEDDFDTFLMLMNQKNNEYQLDNTKIVRHSPERLVLPNIHLSSKSLSTNSSLLTNKSLSTNSLIDKTKKEECGNKKLFRYLHRPYKNPDYLSSSDEDC